MLYIKTIFLFLSIVSLLLLSLNIYGLFKPLRSTSLVEGASDFTGNKLISYKEATQQLNQLKVNKINQLEYLKKVSEIFKHAIIHVDPKDKTDKSSYYQVPIWENYLLYLRQILKKEKVYEYTNYKKTIERGIGLCGQQASALTGFLQEQGVKTSIIYLGGHVIAGVTLNNGEQYTIDPDYGVFMPHSLAELEMSKELVDKYYAKFKERFMWQYYRTDLANSQKNVVVAGGPKERYPMGTIFEQMSYQLKWLIPITVLLMSLFLLKK